MPGCPLQHPQGTSTPICASTDTAAVSPPVREAIGRHPKVKIPREAPKSSGTSMAMVKRNVRIPTLT